nr:immunoglobulin heavy chain junction region [Mus musculus]
CARKYGYDKDPFDYW